LQPMVDDQRSGRLGRGRDGGERQRIRTAGQRDTPAFVAGGVVADESCDGRLQRCYSTLSIHRCGPSISVGSGRVSGLDQMALNLAIPTRPTTWSTNALPLVY